MAMGKLGARGGFGSLGGLGGVGNSPVGPAPTLTLTSPTTNNRPTFNFTSTDIIVVGDVISIQYATNSAFSSASQQDHTVTSTEAIAQSISLSLPSLADGSYWFRAKINSGLWSNTQSETIDAAPTLTNPTGIQTGNTTATVGATTDQGNGTLYYVVTTASNTPSAAQVKAGQTHTGSAAPASGSQAVSSSGVKTANVTGLTAATLYYCHLMHEDAGGNQSAVVDSSSFLTTGSSYVGPGDVVSGAYVWASPARAYSAAFAASAAPIMDLVDQAGNNPITINILTTGFVDKAAISAWVAANSVTTIKIAKLYDQTGNNRHFTQATLANMPTLALNSLNGLPSIASTSASRMDTPTLILNQPYTASTVLTRTSNTGAAAAMGAASGGGLFLGFSPTANNGRFGAGGTINFVMSDAWHSFQGVGNGVSGAYNIDGVDTPSQNAGSFNFASNALRVCTDGASPLTGSLMEAGLWPIAQTATQRANISNNQHGSNGYNF
ncbi:hypothetical protein ACWAT4_21515 [Bradyrhizobium manausense]